MTYSRVLPVLAGMALLAVPSAFAAPVVQERAGLNNTFRKLLRGERTVVAYFGGSITAGAGASEEQFCYRALLTQHLREQFPKAEVVEVNAAIGGTGSWLGAFRLKTDVLERKPDLVVVEFAVNDGGSPEEQVYASMEGIVRQIRAADPQTDILFVYTLVKGHMDAFAKGELPDRMQWHEKVAAHYGIPSVNLAQYAAAKIQAGELSLDEFARDGVHPTDRGYALYLDALKPFVSACRAAAEKAGEAAAHPLPAPFSPQPMEKAKLVSCEAAEHDAHWRIGQPSPAGRFFHVLASDTPGATLSLRFKGGRLGYFDAIGPDTGDLEFSVDGGPWQPRPNWDVFCKEYYRTHCRVVAEGLDPNAVHEVKLRIAEAQPQESKGRFFRLGAFLVDGDVLARDPYAGLTDLQRIDAVYAGMPPLKWAPPAGRWLLLPQTLKRLAEGGTLRLVMLGDSIVNDTSHSRFELLLERLYPRCKVVKVTSVRGSTGCWWYKEENRVQEYVLQHQPDLVMIGGISNREDVDSIREVIRQIRAKSPAEILVMTGAFGGVDPRNARAWNEAVDANGADYRARLLRLAAEEKVEFLDLTGPWGRYVLDSGLTVGWFMRDPVHANERGFQILGRILERYFTPK